MNIHPWQTSSSKVSVKCNYSETHPRRSWLPSMKLTISNSSQQAASAPSAFINLDERDGSTTPLKWPVKKAKPTVRDKTRDDSTLASGSEADITEMKEPTYRSTHKDVKNDFTKMSHNTHTRMKIFHGRQAIDATWPTCAVSKISHHERSFAQNRLLSRALVQYIGTTLRNISLWHESLCGARQKTILPWHMQPLLLVYTCCRYYCAEKLTVHEWIS